jgi:F0F1-type ATP synthase assembly protein I
VSDTGQPQPHQPRDDDGPSETARADALGATVLAYLITGPVLFGGVGYGLDLLLGTRFLVVIGMLGGMALSLYVIWLRYGVS